MYKFNPENVNKEVQLALTKKQFLASKGIANTIVYSDMSVTQSHDELLPKIQYRHSLEKNKIIDNELLVISNMSLIPQWQGTSEILVMDWLISALICLYNNAKSISPNNAGYEKVSTPFYHLGEVFEHTHLNFRFPPTFSICTYITSNATRQLEDMHRQFDWYDSGLFAAVIGMIAQHWKLWSGNLSYPVPAAYSCTQRKNLDDQIRKFVRGRGWAPSVAEQIIECQNTALIPKYSFTSKKVIYENLRHFGHREKLDNQLWLCRSHLAAYIYSRINRDDISFFDGVQGELRMMLLEFVIDNLIAFQKLPMVKL